MKRVLSFSLIPGFVLFVLARPASGEIYRYIDDSGRTHYVTEADEVPEKYRDQVAEEASLPSLSKAPAVQYRNVPTSRYRKQPVVLVMKSCPFCDRLEDFLTKKGVRYRRYDIQSDEKGRKLYQKLGRGGVPITQVGNKMVRGYKPEAIMKLLR